MRSMLEITAKEAPGQLQDALTGRDEKQVGHYPEQGL